MVSQPAPAVGLIVVDEAHWQPDPHHPPVIPPDWPTAPTTTPPHPATLLHPPSRLRAVATRTLPGGGADLGSDRGDHPGTGVPQSQLAADRGHVPVPGPQGRASGQVHHGNRRQTGRSGTAWMPTRRARFTRTSSARPRTPRCWNTTGRTCFKVRIFPIEGNAKKRITVRYTQLLEVGQRAGQLHPAAEHGQVLQHPHQDPERQSAAGIEAAHQNALFPHAHGGDQTQRRTPRHGGL